jgi:hypothetical protein
LVHAGFMQYDVCNNSFLYNILLVDRIGTANALSIINQLK